jgi:hypothetical protein
MRGHGGKLGGGLATAQVNFLKKSLKILIWSSDKEWYMA